MSTTLEMPALARKGYRLSPQQARLWLSQQDTTAYCAQSVISLEGSLRPERLRDALRRVVQQHEILRTVFQDVPGMTVPVQVVTDDGEPSWRYVELEDLDDLAQQAAIEKLCLNELATTSVRALLVEVNPQRHLLVLTLPALCCDTPSMTNLLRHLVEAYADGEVNAEETVQYVQFSEWQNELFEDEESAGRLWWKEQREATAVSDVVILPLEGEEETGPASRIERHLSHAEAEAIERLAREKGATAAVVLLACWQILLARLSGRSQFPLRLMCGGRIYEEMQDALGLYARWPRVDCQVEEDFSFNQVVEQTGHTVAHANEWQEFYFANEDDEVRANGSAQDIGFEFCEGLEARAVSGLSFTLQRQQATTERLKLKLGCVKTAEVTKFQFDYDASVYTAESTQRLAGQFLTLLSSLLENPERAIKHARLLDEVELDCVLRQWARTRAERIPDKCLHELFEEQVLRTPDQLAVVSAEAQLTYRELDTRANQLANLLRQLGVGPESLVGMCLERSVTLMVSLLGILKAGGAYVPLDPGQPARRLSLILNDAGIETVLTEERLKEKFTDAATKIVCVDSEREKIEQQSVEKPLAGVNNRNTVYVIFTSGSTGQPKGVSISHRSVVNLAQALAHAVYAGANTPLRVSVNAPLAFDSSVKQVIQLIYGHTLCIVPEEIRPDGEALLKFIREQHLDALDCTPSQLRLLHEAGFGDGNAADPSIVLVGGEAIDELLWATLCAQSHIAFYNVYGPTECTLDATVCRAASPARPRIGRPITNVEVYVLDRELRPAPVGVMGEVYIGGDCVARGYSNHPDLTADRFVPHPFSDVKGARLYRTGDRGRFLSGGELECAGRVDHQVKLRGNRVELGEIEAALAEHEAVNEVVAIVREDQPGDQRLVAYFVPARNTQPAGLELRDYLSKKLPEYMLPAAIVPLKTLPLTRNGKVDRFNLPAPDQFDVQPGKNFVGPRTPVEEVVADIWAQLFRVKQLSTHDNFFELGGHSLLATQVIARVRKLFKVEVAVRALFESPTVAALSKQIELEIKAGTEKQVAPIERVSREDPIPASFAQQRLWFVHELMPENSGYQLHLSLRIKGALDVAVLERTFTEIVSRHEILRTNFAIRDQKLVQVIAEPAPFKLALEDLSALSPAESEERALHLATEEGYRPFDLKRDVVLRATLWRLAPEEHILGLTTHHIASDEWSINVLVREALTLYESFSNGRPSPLSPLPVQYADYAVWQRRRFDDERLAEELAYWKKQLGDGPYVLDLPTDRPRPAMQTSRGAHQALNISKPLIDTLKALSREEEATLFMAVLAVYKILLHHYTRQSSLIVGTPIADRPQIETEELIGFFVNMLVMRTDLSGDPTFRELLRRVREVALGAYAHQSLPFDKLVEELAPARDLSRNPLFQAAFSFDSSTPENIKLSQLDIQPIEFEGRPIRFDLVVALRDTGDGLTGAIQYNSDLFNASRMTRMRDHFGMLLANVAANPEAKLSELIAQLSEADRQHHDEQVRGFKQARSRMLRNAKVKTVSMPEEKGVAAS
jgi:amino acid adenylation domain-containing protein